MLSEAPCFKDNTEDFKDVLRKIEDLAYRIECNHFALIF